GVGAKLAAGCLLALGVGAGCVALGGGAWVQRHARPRHPAARRPIGRPSAAVTAAQALASTASAPTRGPAAASPAPRIQSSASGASGVSRARQAAREFGPE